MQAALVEQVTPAGLKAFKRIVEEKWQSVSSPTKEDIQMLVNLLMVVDGASSHRSKDLVIPENVALVRLPPYSRELNPAEQIWNILRRNYFANRIFESLNGATAQAEFGLAEMAANKASVKSLTNWPWISAILKA